MNRASAQRGLRIIERQIDILGKQISSVECFREGLADNSKTVRYRTEMINLKEERRKYAKILGAN